MNNSELPSSSQNATTQENKSLWKEKLQELICLLQEREQLKINKEDSIEKFHQVTIEHIPMKKVNPFNPFQVLFTNWIDYVEKYDENANTYLRTERNLFLTRQEQVTLLHPECVFPEANPSVFLRDYSCSRYRTVIKNGKQDHIETTNHVVLNSLLKRVESRTIDIMNKIYEKKLENILQAANQLKIEINKLSEEIIEKDVAIAKKSEEIFSLNQLIEQK